MNQWIGPLFAIATTGAATWMMWQMIRDVRQLRIITLRCSTDASRWKMIDRLRQGGIATSIMFHQSNDDPVTNDDQEAITINADWTGFRDVQYRAASVDTCLAQAINDMERADNGK